MNSATSLPRFQFPDEITHSDHAVTVRLSSPELDTMDDGDATVPAHLADFVLELPDTVIRQVSAFRPLVSGDVAWPTPPAPWTFDPMATSETETPWFRSRMNLLSIVASFILGTAMVVVGSMGTAPEVESNPVGIAVRTPKTLDKSIRLGDRIGGFSPRLDAATVSVDSLTRSHRRF